MKKFGVTLVQTWRGYLEVEAENEEEATRYVMDNPNIVDYDFDEEIIDYIEEL